MASLSTTDVAAIQARYPDVFARPFLKRFTGLLVAAGVAIYLIFAWWLFSASAVLTNANWGIAGAYLADWVTYEVRPDIEIGADGLEVTLPRFSPIPDDYTPGWLKKDADSSGGLTAVTVELGAAGSVHVEGATVTAVRGDETIVFDLAEGSVTPRGELPAWAEQRRPGEKVLLAFGFPGNIEVRDDEVKVRRRFWGWANFLFDTNSPFWGKSAGEVTSLLFSGERIDPNRSNAAVAWNNILNNSEWQHGDVWLKLLQTIVMAFVGTVLATLVAFPLAFAAARNITGNLLVNQVTKRFFDFLRSVDMLIWALFFTRAFGPGPLAGISAIFFTDTGTFGKLYSETLENIDDKQREGIRSVGASPTVVQRYGVLPQVLPVFLSQSLYFWESNTRSATIIGAVGAGGIGLKLWEAMRTNSDWENVAYMVLLILLVVFVFDNISGFLRRRLMGRA
ncbi:MAG TPA: phosphonate ABC transporter, permease protein PhnE [Rhizobiaceae bacterium]|nr:phosphonate ABC transporter, permease protein PhnE [Rhizobiaceae bacterium]